MEPYIAIIIVNWNSYSVTKPCLESLDTVVYNNLKVILVDNGSSDNSGQRLKEEHSGIVLIENQENLGFTGGNNAGIEYALSQDYDAIMLLNNDTIVTPGFVTPLIQGLFSNEKIGAIQPKILYNYDRDIIWNAGGVFKTKTCTPKTIGEGERDKGQFNEPGSTEWITGCCFLVKSKVVENIGLLDQKFFIYYEDLDWSLKIRNHGFDLSYEPSSIIYHEAGMSDQNRDKHGEGNVSPFSRYQEMRNHIYIVKRYANGINVLSAWVYQFFKFSGYLAYYISKGRFKKFQFVIRALIHGLAR